MKFEYQNVKLRDMFLDVMRTTERVGTGNARVDLHAEGFVAFLKAAGREILQGVHILTEIQTSLLPAERCQRRHEAHVINFQSIESGLVAEVVEH